jgi:hypothetical protein
MAEMLEDAYECISMNKRVNSQEMCGTGMHALAGCV